MPSRKLLKKLRWKTLAEHDAQPRGKTLAERLDALGAPEAKAPTLPTHPSSSTTSREALAPEEKAPMLPTHPSTSIEALAPEKKGPTLPTHPSTSKGALAAEEKVPVLPTHPSTSKEVLAAEEKVPTLPTHPSTSREALAPEEKAPTLTTHLSTSREECVKKLFETCDLDAHGFLSQKDLINFTKYASTHTDAGVLFCGTSVDLPKFYSWLQALENVELASLLVKFGIDWHPKVTVSSVTWPNCAPTAVCELDWKGFMESLGSWDEVGCWADFSPRTSQANSTVLPECCKKEADTGAQDLAALHKSLLSESEDQQCQPPKCQKSQLHKCEAAQLSKDLQKACAEASCDLEVVQYRQVLEECRCLEAEAIESRKEAGELYQLLEAEMKKSARLEAERLEAAQDAERRIASVQSLWASAELEVVQYRQVLEECRRLPLLGVPSLAPTLIACPNLVPVIQDVLRSLVPAHHNGPCLAAKSIVVESVSQVFNAPAWKRYCAQKQEMTAALANRHSCPWVHQCAPQALPLTNALPNMIMDSSVNELLLLHGTKDVSAKDIVNSARGFDLRMARENQNLYGKGVYFAAETCKALQYTDFATSGRGCFLVSRVMLGHPYLATGTMRTDRRPPLLNAGGPAFDSVIASPGISRGGGQTQIHSEFVVDDTQAYPELMVHFRNA